MKSLLNDLKKGNCDFFYLEKENNCNFRKFRSHFAGPLTTNFVVSET